jgi:tetratricopeptide (TPR) repeat protein
MQTDWQIGERIENRWEIYKILGGPGKSGMGIVYVVYDHEFHEPFAAKTFQDEVFARDPKIADLFTREAHTWVNLDVHQNVVRARFVQNIRGKPFLFLEYVSGGDLSAWVGMPRLTQDLPQVLRFAIQFCDGMNHALSKRIQAHRDIKPQNCLLTEDNNLKVTDFGLAKVFDDTSPDAAPAASSVPRPANKLEKSGVGFGTPLYMAPEQFADAKHVNVRADIYSFGVMLFQMVTGGLPFKGGSYFRLRSEAAPPPLGSGHSALDMIVGKCLAKLAGERYAAFGTLREELASVYESIAKQPAPKPASGRELEAEELDNKGASLRNLVRYEEALTCHDRAIALNPQLAEAWCNKGAALGGLGRHKEALTCHDRAIALNPQLAEAWSAKGDTLERLGHSEEALACCERAIGINPRHAEAWYNKGRLLESLGRYEEAVACDDRAIVLNPQDAQAWYNKGVALERLGHVEEALTCYDCAIALDPQIAEAWYNKGNALSSLGRPEEALPCYDRVLFINPQYAQAWLNKGVALGNLGRAEEALACYDHALAVNPRFAEAWFNKGAVLFNDFKRACEAIPYFEKARRLRYPNAAEAIAVCRDALRAAG